MRTKEVIEQEYQQSALELGHLYLREEMIKAARVTLMQKVEALRAEYQEVAKVEAELEARKKAEVVTEKPSEESNDK